MVRSTLETPDSGLNREQFALALRLVAAAQASHTPHAIKGPVKRTTNR